MKSVRLVCDEGAGEGERREREMPQRACSRSGGSAPVRTLECGMIVWYTNGPV